ncbi:multidrug resistance protein Fnx1 [Xylaria longipes]|nr:multidrug resistance protein Fnx1 [Xylaria longipes]
MRPSRVPLLQVEVGWRFGAMFLALCVTSLLSAIDATIISTVLPAIVADLQSESLYVWALNAFFISMTTVQPLYGQTANIFGRRVLVIGAILFFALGSGLCGGAKNTGMFIAGRVIQGIGGGGINIMIDMVVCDLVPQRERGKYIGFVFIFYSVGTTIGPLIGGAFAQHATWRWAFYVNLPIVAVALPLVVLFLRVNYDRETHILKKLARIDYAGNTLLTLSVISILIAIIFGGTVHPYNSWRTIVPIVLGIIGHILFVVQQGIPKLAPEPTMPLYLFKNRTSAFTLALTFVHGMLQYWMVYFIPLYLQSVKLFEPTYAGVGFLPSVLVTIPFAVVGGTLITATNRYRPPQIAGISLMVIGIGLYTLLDRSSTTGMWVGFQIIASAGCGLLLTCTLPAVQAPLPEKDVATATGTWGFLRSYGAIWGVSIPSAVFNSRVGGMLHTISDPAVRAALGKGGAYEHGTANYIRSLAGDPQLQTSVINVYVSALKLVWQVGIGFAGVGVIVALLIKEVPMLQQLETSEFGFEYEKKEKDSEKGTGSGPEPESKVVENTN